MIYIRYLTILFIFECATVYTKNIPFHTLSPQLSHDKSVNLSKYFNAKRGFRDLNEGDFDFRDDHEDSKDADVNKHTDRTSHEKTPGNDDNNKDGRDYDGKLVGGDLNKTHVDSIHTSGHFTDDNKKEDWDNKDKDHTSSNKNEDVKNFLDELKRDEHINEMQNDAKEMIDLAKETKEKGNDIVKEHKNQEDVHSDKQTIPKHQGPGDIVITNNTHVAHKKEDEQERIDPLQPIRDAILSLYQRAKQKNLPVEEPGDLTTPDKIHVALNYLEYTIDAYRHSRLETPAESEPLSDSEEPNINEENTDDVKRSVNQEGVEVEDEPKFLQLKNVDDEDEEPEDSLEDEVDDESDENGTLDEMPNKAEDKKSPEMSPQEAMDQIKNIITELLSLLNDIVESNTGVKNVITHNVNPPVPQDQL